MRPQKKEKLPAARLEEQKTEVFVFGSFSEDEASLFQKASGDGEIKPAMLTDLQFGSLNNQFKVSSRTSEIAFKQDSYGQEVNKEDLKEKSKAPPNGNSSIPNGGKANKSALKVLTQASNGSQDESVTFNSAKSQVSAIDSHQSPPVNNSESFHFPDSEEVTSVNNTDKVCANLDLCGNNAIAENGEKRMTEKNQCTQEQKLETKSNLTGTSFGTLQQFGPSGLNNGDALDGAEEASSVSPSDVPKSWAARFGGKVANNVQALYSHGGDKGRSKPATAGASIRSSPGKVNGNSSAILTSNDRAQKNLGEEEVTGKRLLPRGLVNSGNLCFLNATLQALLSCTPFLQLLQSLRSRDISEAGSPTLKAFVEFVAEFDEDRPDDVIPKKNDKAIEVLEAGKAFCPSMFDPVLKSFSPDQPLGASGRTRQEDAQEFLSFVMDRMHDELLKLEGGHLTSSDGKLPMIRVTEEDDWETVGPKNRTAVTRTQSFIESELSAIFGGQLRSVVKSRGNKASATVQRFLVLHLDILPDAVNTVEDALHLFASPESLEGYRISAGKAGVVSASKSVKLQTLSKVLILHLMRFSYGSTGSSKLHKPVRFHPEIILGRELLVSPTTKGRRYELVATVSHHGRDPSRGHYTADAKHSDGWWLRFDDASVSVVGLNKVLHDQAYVLFYKQI